MSSNKQKRQKLKLTRAEKKAELKRVELLAARSRAELELLANQRRAELEKAALLPSLEDGTIIAVDRSKIISRCAIPKIPEYYRDTWFTCKDCGAQELWTAKQQQRWYEEQGGEIEAFAVRCHSCRRKQRGQPLARPKS
jgi:hypothetical protein